MDTSYALFAASVLGAVALYLMMPRAGASALSLRLLGGLLGAGTLGGLWLVLFRHLPSVIGMSWAGFAYYYVFSAIAIGAAVRVITHPKPIYAALWFVMVVLASAGLFLVLGAPFMALAMVIIYGGAILVTYVFVIMLAAQAGDPEKDLDAPLYDRVAREPAGAIIAGFVLLATLAALAFQPLQPNPDAVGVADATLIERTLTQRPDKMLAARAPAGAPPHTTSAATTQPGSQAALALAAAGLDPRQLSNTERIGVDLFSSHPLGLELAGVILLVSLIGAVVIARMRVEAEPEEEREA